MVFDYHLQKNDVNSAIVRCHFSNAKNKHYVYKGDSSEEVYFLVFPLVQGLHSLHKKRMFLVAKMLSAEAKFTYLKLPSRTLVVISIAIQAIRFTGPIEHTPLSTPSENPNIIVLKYGSYLRLFHNLCSLLEHPM